MVTTQSAKTTIYYTPYKGDHVPIYDGSHMTPTQFVEISASTTDTTKNPAAIGASKVNDWFIWNDSGTLRLSHGPDWTSDTARSTGTALVMVNGVLLNNVDITNGPAAQRGSYAGTTRSDASSKLNWIVGGSGSGGVAAALHVWNCYNQVKCLGQSIDTTASGYLYNGGGVREAGGSAGNQVSLVIGLQEETADITYATREQSNGGASSAYSVGIGIDSTSDYVVQNVWQSQAATVIQIGHCSAHQWQPPIGFHVAYALENSDGSSNHTFNRGSNNTFSASIRM
jgi:hypothetical protein